MFLEPLFYFFFYKHGKYQLHLLECLLWNNAVWFHLLFEGQAVYSIV